MEDWKAWLTLSPGHCHRRKHHLYELDHTPGEKGKSRHYHSPKHISYRDGFLSFHGIRLWPRDGSMGPSIPSSNACFLVCGEMVPLLSSDLNPEGSHKVAWKLWRALKNIFNLNVIDKKTSWIFEISVSANLKIHNVPWIWTYQAVTFINYLLGGNRGVLTSELGVLWAFQDFLLFLLEWECYFTWTHGFLIENKVSSHRTWQPLFIRL